MEAAVRSEPLRRPTLPVGALGTDVGATSTWKRGRITVARLKTEHHEGKAERVMPLFPELRPYLEAVRDELLDGLRSESEAAE